MEGVGVVIKLFYFSTSTPGNQHILKVKVHIEKTGYAPNLTPD